MRPTAPRFVAASALTLVCACAFQDGVPEGARIICSANDDCPPRMRCAGIIGRCVADDGDSAPPSADAELSTTLLPADGDVEVNLAPSEPLAVEPQVQAGELKRDAALSDDGAYRTRFGAAELGAGAHPVFALLVDQSGNVGLVTIGAVTVDLEPPAIDGDTPIQWRITSPPGVVVAEPTRVTRGSTVTVGFDVSEPLEGPPAVRAVGPEERAFSFLGERDGLFTFELHVDAPLTAGEYRISAELVDLAGNEATVDVPLPPPGFVADEVVPSPCVAVDQSGAPQCTDFDGDGAFGLSPACGQPAPYDCDDTDPTSHEGAFEIPGDGKDNDCAGDGDLPLDESSAVFADPGAASGGDGTRAAPFDDLFAATDASRAAGKALALRAGDFGDVPAGWFTAHAVIGGLDDEWRFDPEGRTRVRFVTLRDTVFPEGEPHPYVGLDLASLNSLIESNNPVTLVHCELDAVDRALFTSDRMTLIDVDVSSGYLETASVHIVNSKLAGGDLFTQSGLVLRSTLEVQVGLGLGDGALWLVSSSLWTRGRDRGFSVEGKLRIVGSNVRVLGSDENDPEPPAMFELYARDILVAASALESRRSIVDWVDGWLDVRGAALATPCVIRGADGACALAPEAADCGGAAGCTGYQNITVLDALTALPDDPHHITTVLAGPGPSLLELGAPTAAAGDRAGRCRDTSAPTLGADEPE